MLRASLLVLVGLLAVPSSSASLPSPQTDSTTVAVDSAHISVRSPSDTLLARFRNDPAFNYQPPEGWTWWQDLKRWVGAQFAKLFGSGTTGGDVLQLLFYLVLALLIGYAAYMLLQLRFKARAPGRTAPETIARPQTAEEMRAIDFDDLLDAALAAGDYRQAVRLLYQQTLQHLDRADAIAWRPSKTNREYVNEVDADVRPAFSTLTRLFEQIWYGGAAVDVERFPPLRAQFESFWEDLPSSGHGAHNDDVSSASPPPNTRTADRSA